MPSRQDRIARSFGKHRLEMFFPSSVTDNFLHLKQAFGLAHAPIRARTEAFSSHMNF
jgi:hypothetical protein